MNVVEDAKLAFLITASPIIHSVSDEAASSAFRELTLASTQDYPAYHIDDQK
jgi:hypothetical protein